MSNAHLFDRYADAVIAGHPENFDAIEVHGVRSEAGETVVDNDDPQFFSVYLHYKPDMKNNHMVGLQCAGDFSRRAHALAFAAELHRNYDWPISDYSHDVLPKRAWERMTDDVLLDGAKNVDANTAVLLVADQVGITDFSVATQTMARYAGAWSGMTASLRVQALETWQNAERVANIDYAPQPDEVEEDWKAVLRAVLPYAQSRAEDISGQAGATHSSAIAAWEAVNAAHKLLGTKS